MGAKQSSSPSSAAAANGRTRAYSGSDLPSSTDGSRRTAAPSRHHPNSGHPGVTSSTSQNIGGRASSAVRSESRSHSGISIPGSGGPFSSPETSASTPEDSDRAEAAGPRLMVGSLPAHLSPHLFGGFKCPVCSKFVSSDDMDLHLVLCLTKPRITYNEDVLNKDTGECAICLDDLEQGDTIARLPCLCIYHKIAPFTVSFGNIITKKSALTNGLTSTGRVQNIRPIKALIALAVSGYPEA